jgi:hypothetical protein
MAAAGASRGSAGITVALGLGIGLGVGLLAYFGFLGISHLGHNSVPIAIALGLIAGASAAYRYRRQGAGTRRPADDL